MINMIFKMFFKGFGPSESELQEILRDMEDPQQMGYIQYDRFYPVMSKIITHHKYELATTDELLEAFKVSRNVAKRI